MLMRQTVMATPTNILTHYVEDTRRTDLQLVRCGRAPAGVCSAQRDETGQHPLATKWRYDRSGMSQYHADAVCICRVSTQQAYTVVSASAR